MSKKNPVDDLYNVAKKVQKTRLLNNYTNLLDEWSVDELTFDELTWYLQRLTKVVELTRFGIDDY